MILSDSRLLSLTVATRCVTAVNAARSSASMREIRERGARTLHRARP